MFLKHKWDDVLLRAWLTSAFLLGSHEWVKEHDQALILNPGKTFYLLVENDEVVAMFSLKGKSFGDAHTVASERGKGKMESLLSYFESEIQPGTHATTRNEVMAHLLEKHSFRETGKRGRFSYMVKIAD